ncbi:MAG: hypothetical protein M9890_02155 [Thermomicrobiales bacterium]|nr:hypothetical protein [Thermomicrobiales bacterium]
MTREARKLIQSIVVVTVGAALFATSACNTDSTHDSASSPISSAAASLVLPTPIQDGVWNALTVEQARALASFPLAIPDPMPDSLQLTNIVVMTSPPSGALGKTNYAEVHIMSTSGTSKIVLTETTRETQLNVGDSVTRRTLDINGTSVDKVDDPRGDGKTTLSYSWNSNGVWYSVVALMPSADVTETQLEQLITNLNIAE